MSGSNYHSHAWLTLTSAANGSTAGVTGLDLLQVTDSASLTGPQQVTAVLAGRTLTGTPWRELLSVGDLIEVGMQRTDGEKNPVAITGSQLMVQDVQVSESMQPGGYSLTTSVTATGVQDLLQVDAVAWWMYYGLVRGAVRTMQDLMPDVISGKLDSVFANYYSKVVMPNLNWERDGVGLEGRMGFDFSSLKANVPPLYNLTITEGSHWDIVGQYAEPALHEYFVAQRTRDGRVFKGQTHHPSHRGDAILSTSDPGSCAPSYPYVVLRPKPFPYADKNGQPVMSDWNALTLHDLGRARATTGQHGFGKSVAGVRNYTMVYPGYEMMNDSLTLSKNLAVYNDASIKRFGYRPVKMRTNLILNDGPKQNMLDMARELTWRVAAQTNRMDEYTSGSITVPLAPEIQPGDRARFRLIHTDGTPGGLYQGYVTNRTHAYQAGGGGTTSLTLERVLPDSVYGDPSWFVQGLALAETAFGTPQHSKDPL